MENKEKTEEKYIPRYVLQQKEVQKSSYVRFKEWAQGKMKFKAFRHNVGLELARLKRRNEQVDIHVLRSMLPFMMLNSVFITLFLTRKQGAVNMIAKSVAACSFTYLAIVTFAEEVVFHQNCLRDDEVGFFLRERYIREMKDFKYNKLYEDLNEKFMKKYETPSKEELEKSLEKLGATLSK